MITYQNPVYKAFEQALMDIEAFCEMTKEDRMDIFILICDEFDFRECDELLWNRSYRTDLTVGEDGVDGRMQFDLLQHPNFDEWMVRQSVVYQFPDQPMYRERDVICPTSLGIRPECFDAYCNYMVGFNKKRLGI